MPLTSSRRLHAVVAAVAAAAILPLTVAPASAAPAPTAAGTTATVSTSALGGAVRTGTSPAVRWVKADRARVTKRFATSRTVARPDDGTRLVVLDRSPNRLKVRLPGGRKGWVSKQKVTGVPLRDLTGTRHTTQRVRVTAGINASSRTVAYAALGTTTKRLARTTERPTTKVKVKLPGGRTGWVAAKRLTTRDVWGQLAQCESGGRVHIATGNGYYGMYQFTASTWRAVGGSGLPHHHGAREQTKRAQILQARAGWGQWPHCTSKLGLR
ncbi:transglycosylase family protein [Isoptericola aurantiacus]|uniref:transglycosylase family protein n=1 Tax=Isoptericola aurantiacus TaxID=3377839 RepID=UPI00383BB952